MSQEARLRPRPARERAGVGFRLRRPALAALRWVREHPVAIIRRTISTYLGDNCSTYAAAMAYYALFSLIPLTLITLSVFGLILSDQRIEDFIFEQLPLQDSPSVRDDVHQIVDRAKVASGAGIGVGVVILLWSASGIFTAVRRGLNVTRHSPSKPYWKGKLLDLGLVPMLGVLILVFVGAMVTTQVIFEEVSGIGAVDVRSNETLRAVSITVTALLSFVSFLFLYRFVPGARPAWGEAVTAALCAAAMFESLRHLYGFVFALTPFSRENALYASFGTALTFLLWMYLNASILLIGAVFARTIWERREENPALIQGEGAIVT